MEELAEFNQELAMSSRDSFIPFNFNEQNVRVIMRDNEPWFVAADVTRALGFTNGRKAVVDNCDEEDVTASYPLMTKGGLQKLTLINESGIYSIIVSSRLKSAKEFKKWVTSEVLPSIRKNGSYGIKKELTTVELLRIGLEAAIERDRLQALIQEQAPKVEYADAVLHSQFSIQLGEYCRQFSIGRNKLFEKMREDKILISGGVLYNTPYQNFIDAGYFEVEKSISKDGLHQKLTTYITGKGELWLCKRLNLSKSTKITVYKG